MGKFRSERHVVREKARKRTKSLFRKANQLAQVTDVNVYLVIDRHGKFQIYNSSDVSYWPPPEQEMSKNGSTPRIQRPIDFEPVGDRARVQKRPVSKAVHRTNGAAANGDSTREESLNQIQRVFSVPDPPSLPDLGSQYLAVPCTPRLRPYT